MDLYIEKDELVRALAGIQGVVERRSTHQILGHALLTAKEDNFQVTATDTELTVITGHNARIEKPGSVSMNAGHFFQVAKFLPKGPVHIYSQDNSYVVVDAPPAHYRLMGAPMEEFPPVPPFEGSSGISVTAGGLQRMIEETIFAIPTDETRYGLNGAHLEQVGDSGSGQRIRMVATDGNRLCYSEIPFDGEFGMGEQMLLPRKVLVECRKHLVDPAAKVEITFGDRAATIEIDKALFHTRMVDGEFPPYRNVMPSSFSRKAVVDREIFQEGLIRVALEAQDRANTIKMEFSEAEVLVSARSVDHGEARHPIPIQFEGEPTKMGFNVKFFLDVLQCLRDDKLILELGEPLAPCIVKVEGRDDVCFVVMPIRLD